MNETFTATPAPVSLSENARHLNLADLGRRNRSIVGYVAVTAIVFGAAEVTGVTVFRHGDTDRVAMVTHENGTVTTFLSNDGDWHDSKGIVLDKRDADLLDEHATWLIGGGD